MSFAISGSWLLSPDGRLLQDHTIVIDDTFISEIVPTDHYTKPRGIDQYTLKKHLITPPLVNGHTHIPETLIRGLSDDTDLQTWLYDNVWQVEPNMTASDAKYGALLGIAEMLSTGTGVFIDQFYYTEQIAEAVLESGIKALLAPSIFADNPESGTITNALKLNRTLLQTYHNQDNRLMIGCGPHAPYSVDDETYMQCYELATKYQTYIHTHLSETRKDVKVSKEQFNLTPIQHLDNLGILDRVLAAHCVHLEPQDFELLQKAGTTVLHNPQSNLKLGSGIADVPRMVDFGINVLIGTDGSASNNNLDMLEEIRTAILLHKGVHMNPKILPSELILQMSTTNAASIFGEIYSGRLEVNQPADLVAWDLTKINMTPIISPISNLVYSANPNSVKMNIINGNILYLDGKFTTLDIDTILLQAQKSSDRMRGN